MCNFTLFLRILSIHDLTISKLQHCLTQNIRQKKGDENRPFLIAVDIHELVIPYTPYIQSVGFSNITQFRQITIVGDGIVVR